MPRESSQKLKLLYVMRYLLRSSDEAHPVTVQQIIDFLSGEGSRLNARASMTT